MTSSEFEQLKLIQQLLSDLNPIFISIFIMGIITGVFFFTDLVNRLDRLSYRFRRPRRIKRSADFGEHGDFEYLYLFKGRYYSLGEYQDLRAKARNKFLNKRNLSI
ncbi:hypothetical protein HUN33_18360 [Acinetobacter bereziniae]|uniref:hypothetical protein n=1 Tax=Acinetobacter bereziniae TaxID=106648 RepID=UPI001580282F|nr:hypothetical protein [Acinetobacter bereziniae]NUF65007.1 hypothetical protein [Acinetobacter bereziniae]NUG08457.1 hypothetical protein [Acinetobacter bereziniae]NUG65171.1 hypothetical protein [Acinetobacter bereziniae]NUG71439.1 hypothetical protein [Acinetobacter bereziniae]NUG81980.1 hypothetical protein [Acinetobacter bereziniae]